MSRASSLLYTCFSLQFFRQKQQLIRKSISGGGIRWTSQTQPDDQEDQREKNRVWQNWVISILENSSKKKETEDKEGYLKRPGNSKNSELVRRISAESKARAKMASTTGTPTWEQWNPSDKIIWVDCEMSGLDPSKDKLLEIGLIITDGNLNVIAKQDSIVFKVEDSVLSGMGEWCLKTHGESGLIDSCKNSTTTHEAADEAIVKFVEQYTGPRESPIAGNSIGIDQSFIRFQLPKFYAHCHYRVIDVSTIKELTRRWYPEVLANAPKKRFSHRVIDDIEDSIQELKYYRSTIFVPSEAVTKKEAGEDEASSKQVN